MCQEVLRLAGWLTVARPAVRYGPVRLALTPAHLPELTCLLPYHLSRRTKCAMVSWQSSPKCQPGVTNPCRPLGPRRPGSVGSCPGSDGEPGTCHGNNNHWSTTVALPSCPGRTELVRWGRGWLFSLLALNLTKLGYSLVDRGQLDRNETSPAGNALGEHAWTPHRSNPIPLKLLWMKQIVTWHLFLQAKDNGRRRRITCGTYFLLFEWMILEVLWGADVGWLFSAALSGQQLWVVINTGSRPCQEREW